jgi:hypothetical protein
VGQAITEIRGLNRFDFDVEYVDDPGADASSLQVPQLRQRLREVIRTHA